MRKGPGFLLNEWLMRRCSYTVQSGPFRGLRYPRIGTTDARRLFTSELPPKILGTYEKELHDWIENFLAAPHDVFIDIGAAEGYYAVGFAVRAKQRVVAFEMSDDARNWLKTLAKLNDVEAFLEVKARCDGDVLEQALAGANNPSVLCDVDGFEWDLLNPTLVPSLKRATILVEVHEPLCPGIVGELERRFSESHGIEIRPEERRVITDNPCLNAAIRMLPRRWTMRALEEGRPFPQHWMLLKPKLQSDV